MEHHITPTDELLGEDNRLPEEVINIINYLEMYYPEDYDRAYKLVNKLCKDDNLSSRHILDRLLEHLEENNPTLYQEIIQELFHRD